MVKNVGLDQNVARAVAADQSDKNYDTSKMAKVTWPTDSEILSSSKYKIVSHLKSQFVVADINETDALIGFKLIDEPDQLLLKKNSGGTAKWSVKAKTKVQVSGSGFLLACGSNDQNELKADMSKWANSFDSTICRR